MQMVPFFVHVVAAATASALLASVWQGALLVMVVALALRWVPGLSAAVRSVVWIAMLVVIMGLPVVEAIMPHAVQGRASAIQPGLHVNALWSVLLLAVWLAAASFRLAQLVLSALRVRSLGKRARCMPIAPELAAILANSNRRVELCTSAEVDRPSLAGFFRSRILLPPDTVASLTPEELQLVVLHEMEHLRRRDEWTNLLQKLALVVFPLHPVLFWLDRRLCLERELACDDGVLRQTCGPKAYATVLARLAEARLMRRGMTLVLGALGVRQSELGRRVHGILAAPAAVMSQVQARAVAAVLVVGVLAGSAGLARAPQLVSFLAPTDKALQVQAAVTAPLVPASLTQSHSMYVPAAYVPSVYGARTSLLKATMPAKTPVANKQVRRTAPTLFTPRLQRVAYRVPQQREAQWVVVTTTWQPTSETPVVTHISMDSASTYAAIATRDGWLIVQL